MNNITFEALHGRAPTYVSELVPLKQQNYVRTRSSTFGERNLIALSMNDKKFGDRMYAGAAPRLWNVLPVHLKNCDEQSYFKKQSNVYLYISAFKT